MITSFSLVLGSWANYIFSFVYDLSVFLITLCLTIKSTLKVRELKTTVSLPYVLLRDGMYA